MPGQTPLPQRCGPSEFAAAAALEPLRLKQERLLAKLQELPEPERESVWVQVRELAREIVELERKAGHRS